MCSSCMQTLEFNMLVGPSARVHASTWVIQAHASIWKTPAHGYMQVCGGSQHMGTCKCVGGYKHMWRQRTIYSVIPYFCFFV